MPVHINRAKDNEIIIGTNALSRLGVEVLISKGNGKDNVGEALQTNQGNVAVVRFLHV